MGTCKFNADGNPAIDWQYHLGRSGNTPSRFMPQKPEISAGLTDHLARMQTLPLPFWSQAVHGSCTVILNSECSKEEASFSSLAVRHV